MKTILLSALVVLATHAVQGQSLAMDPAASQVLWTATKVTGQHTGGVPLQGGQLIAADGVLTSAEVRMDMTGLTCIDIESEGANAKLVGHLKSSDFFDVEQHGVASFTTTTVEKLPHAAPGTPNYRVTGDLTIKGITHPNTFEVLFWMDGKKARAAASFTFDRSQYDVKYRSGTFFADLGDKAISDTVSLTFDVTAQ